MEQAQILLINDGSPLLHTMAGLLESKSFRTKVTENTEEAVKELSVGFIDLVIMKLHGTKTDYVTLLHMIKELRPGAKIVIMSDQASLPVDAYEIEIDDYIIMPCKSAELWRRIFNCLTELGIEPVSLPAKDRLNGINQQVLNKLGLLFHDVRGTLVSIAAGIKILRRKTNGSLGADIDDLIDANYNKATKLIYTMEDFLTSCFSSKKCSEKEPNYFDIRKAVVDPILDELWDDLLKNHITVVNRLDLLPAHLGSIQGDRAALKSAFRNLLTNAVKHGGVGCTIQIDMEKQGANFQLRVYNSGPPISPDRRSKIFTKFTPLAKKGNGNGQGMGLGLYLSREILKSHGGDIHYEPAQNGSNFILTLPRG